MLRQYSFRVPCSFNSKLRNFVSSLRPVTNLNYIWSCDYFRNCWLIFWYRTIAGLVNELLFNKPFTRGCFRKEPALMKILCFHQWARNVLSNTFVFFLKTKKSSKISCQFWTSSYCVENKRGITKVDSCSTSSVLIYWFFCPYVFVMLVCFHFTSWWKQFSFFQRLFVLSTSAIRDTSFLRTNWHNPLSYSVHFFSFVQFGNSGNEPFHVFLPLSIPRLIYMKNCPNC